MMEKGEMAREREVERSAGLVSGHGVREVAAAGNAGGEMPRAVPGAQANSTGVMVEDREAPPAAPVGSTA
jgi:hypothetical protein